MKIFDPTQLARFAPVFTDETQQDQYWKIYEPFHDQGPLLRHSLNDWQGVVLFLLIDDSLILIKRSERLKSYRGQMALIGGKRDPGEVDMLSVAKREFIEETNLEVGVLKIIALLPLVYSARAHLIAPLLAQLQMTESEFAARVESNGEWDYILSVPLETLKDESKWVYALNRGRQDTLRTLLFCPLMPEEVRILKGPRTPHPPSFQLWGATARMVRNFLQIIQTEK